MAGTSAVVKESVMAADIEQDCVDCAAYALQQENLDEQRSLAQFIKKELDFKYGKQWHVICGRFFGSYVSHDPKEYTYFSIGDVHFLIWRTEWSGKEVAIPTYPVRGRVVSNLTGEYVFGARIECGSTWVRSGANGVFEIDLIYGPKTLLFSAKEHHEYSINVDVQRNGAVELGDIVINSKYVRRTGVVVDSSTKQPVSGATIVWAGSGAQIDTLQTNENGEFMYEGLPGSYSVTIRKGRLFFPVSTKYDLHTPKQGEPASEHVGSISLAPLPTCRFLTDMAEGRDRHYIVVIDTSGSMDWAGSAMPKRWDEARAANELIARGLENLGQAFDIIFFSTDAQTVPLVTSEADAKVQFGANSPGGGTNLIAAIDAAAERHRAVGRDTSWLIITDGTPNGGIETNAKKLVDTVAAQPSEQALHVSFIGCGKDPKLEEFLAELQQTQTRYPVLDSIRESQCGGHALLGIVQALLGVSGA